MITKEGFLNRKRGDMVLDKVLRANDQVEEFFLAIRGVSTGFRITVKDMKVIVINTVKEMLTLCGCFGATEKGMVAVKVANDDGPGSIVSKKEIIHKHSGGVIIADYVKK